MIVRDEELADALASLGRQSEPLEACGVAVPLVGGGWAVVDCMNHASDPRKSWETPGWEMAEAIRIACAEGKFFDCPAADLSQDSPVVWHSHPGGNVGPSEEDMSRRVNGLRHAVIAWPSGSTPRLTYY